MEYWRGGVIEYWSNGVCRFKKEKLLIPVFLLFVIISCQSETDKYRVSQIDTVSFRMEEMASVYLEIDTVKIISSYKTILLNIDKLNSLSEPEDRRLLIDYGALKKGFKEFIKSAPVTLEELEVCREQIKNLKDDAANGLYSQDDFDLYLKHEANASQSLRVQMSYYHTRITSLINKFERLNPRIERVIDSLSIIK